MSSQKQALEASVAIIKSEPIADGRMKEVKHAISGFCSKNSLQIVYEGYHVMLAEDVKMHFASHGKYSETGGKMLRAIAREPQEKQEELFNCLRDMGIQPEDKEKIGRFVEQTELLNYPGKQMYVMAVVGEDAISKLFSIRGPSDPTECDGRSIRGAFSKMSITDIIKHNKPMDNVVHIPSEKWEASEHIQKFFSCTHDEFVAMNLAQIQRKVLSRV